MVDPKTFYRELDALLAAIRIEKSDGNLLSHTVNMLESTFADRIHIANGRIYEARGDQFTLVYPENADTSRWTKHIPRDTNTISLAHKNRSYIYDRPDLNQVFLSDPNARTHISTAIWVHTQEEQWLIVFELVDGWVREEVSLFLNAVRTSLNYRLFTDIIGGRLEQAVEIQKSLLPKDVFKVEGYDIHGRSQPAELVGGDFYDYYDLEEGNFGVTVGDASGHGIPAALLVRDVVIGLRMGLAKELRLVHTLQKLNKVIQRSTYSTNFVSLFVGEIERDGHVFYVNAGHPAPFLVTEYGIQDLGATGITLGFLPEIKLSRSHIHMPRNSILVLYTDGIVERENKDGKQYEIHQLKKLVHQNRRSSAEKILSEIYAEAFKFGNQTKWGDDATAVVIKRL